MKTVREIAKEFKVHPATVKIWIREGKLKAKITPKGYVVSQEALDEFILKHN